MKVTTKPQGRTTREILTVIFKYKLLIIFIFTVIMASVYISFELRTPVYEARVKVLVTGKMPKDLEYIRSLGRGSETDTQKELVFSRPVLERTVRALKLDERPLDYEKKFASTLKKYRIDWRLKKLKPLLAEMSPEEKKQYLFSQALGRLKPNVNAFQNEQKSSIFEIIVKDFSPAQAVKIANVVSRSFVIFDLEQQIAELYLMYGNKNVTIQKLQHHIKQLEDSLDGKPLSDIEALGPASVKIISQAQIASKIPKKPTKKGALFIAFILSLLVSSVFLVMLDYFDHTFKSPFDIERALQVPYLGSIPKNKSNHNSLIQNINELTRYTYSYQDIAEDIYILMKDKKISSLLLTDTKVSESTSTVIVNLGRFLAKKMKQLVLIIDANIKAPTLSKVLNVPNSPGLVEVLEGKHNFDDVIKKIDDDMYVVTSGGSIHHTLAILECSKMKNLVEKAKENFGIVLVNYACLKQYCDAIILSTLADGALIIVNDGKSKKQDIIDSVNFMKQKDIKVIGAIINDRKFVLPKIIYQYT